MSIHTNILNRDTKDFLIEKIPEHVILPLTAVLNIVVLKINSKKYDRCIEKHEIFLLTNKYLYCLYDEPAHCSETVEIMTKVRIHLHWVICYFTIDECNGNSKYCIEFVKNNHKIVFEVKDREKYDKWQDVLKNQVVQPYLYKKYKISNLIATQRYGRLYKSVEISSKNVFFVEKINKDNFLDDDKANNIICKIKALKKLRGCPGIIQLHEIYGSQKSVYLVYEPYFGGPVFNFTLKYDMPIFFKILKNIFGILKSLDNYRITNGYLRPKNIYFKHSHQNNESDDIIITDFSYLTIKKRPIRTKMDSIRSIPKIIGKNNHNTESNIDLKDLGFIIINYLYYRQFNKPIEKQKVYKSVILDASFIISNDRKLIS